MKTQQEIEKMMESIQNQIGLLSNEMSGLHFMDVKYRNVNRSKNKLVAQYNILLEVLK